MFGIFGANSPFGFPTFVDGPGGGSALPLPPSSSGAFASHYAAHPPTLTESSWPWLDAAIEMISRPFRQHSDGAPASPWRRSARGACGNTGGGCESGVRGCGGGSIASAGVVGIAGGSGGGSGGVVGVGGDGSGGGVVGVAGGGGG